MRSPNATTAGGLPGKSGAWAAGLAHWLSLAAAPCFALLALHSATGGDASMLCAPGQGAFRLGGMAAMYLVMSAFHLPAWLRRSGHFSG
jgi:hypothetical protein